MIDFFDTECESIEMKKEKGQWLINESIGSDYFDFIQLICDHKLWFLWHIAEYNYNTFNDNKYEPLLQFLHNQCVCNNNEKNNKNMIEIMIDQKRVKMVDFMIENKYILKSHWCNYLFLNQKTVLLSTINNSMFWQTLIEMMVNDLEIIKSMENDNEYYYYYLQMGGVSYYQYFWENKLLDNAPMKCRDLIFNEKKIALPQS